MFKYVSGLGIILLILLISSCRKDFEFQNSSGNLEFSKDTVYLDTVFTNISSSTYSFKVYNRSNEDIQIPSVRLGEGEASRYRLNVDGIAGQEFSNVSILAKDSIFVFVETTFDVSQVNEPSFLYVDDLLFDSGNLEQKVPLVTLVKDAIFLYPTNLQDGTKETLLLGIDDSGEEIRINGFILEDEELNFTNEKPYVIYGYAAVTSNKSLTIEAGARVHFHKDSGIIVGQQGSLKINGALSLDNEVLENEVIFEGDRLEPEFSGVPGQWGFIWLTEGSLDNEINHLTIKNASVGILVEGDGPQATSTLTIKNTQVYNSSITNLWGRKASIEAENIVLGNAGVHSLHCNLGGSYSFKHSTIANYWNNSFRNSPALQIDNFLDLNAGQQLSGDLQKVDFINCIIDGNTGTELILSNNGTNAFNYSFTNCSVQFQDNANQFSSNPLYDFQNGTPYMSILLNVETDFVNTSKQDFRLTNSSGVLDVGEPNTALDIPLDILGIDRSSLPDLGAYEFTSEN